MDIFPEYRTSRAFVHLEFTVRHGRAHALSGESIRQHLLNKISPGDGIRGTPSQLEEDICIRAPKLSSQAGPNGPIQLQSLVILGLLTRGPGPKPVAPTPFSYVKNNFDKNKKWKEKKSRGRHPP